MRRRRMEWYASGGGIGKGGPYPSEHAAREGMRLTEHAQARQWREHGTSSPYPHDLVVWPEPAGGDR